MQSSKSLNPNLEDRLKDLKAEFALDLRGIGKELAIDIVSLNKKIDQKHCSL